MFYYGANYRKRSYYAYKNHCKSMAYRNRRSKAYRNRYLARLDDLTYTGRFRERDFSMRQRPQKLKVTAPATELTMTIAMPAPSFQKYERIFQLADVTTARPELVSGWDQYRIVKIRLDRKIVPVVDNQYDINNEHYPNLEFFEWTDRDGGNTASFDEVRTKNRAKLKDWHKSSTTWVDPYIQGASQGTLGIVASTGVRSPWLDMANPDVHHFGYGLGWMPAVRTAGPENLTHKCLIIPTYYLEVRDTR